MINTSNYSLLSTSYLFPILNIFTLLLVYAKNVVDLYVRWAIILLPSSIFFLIEIMKTLMNIFFNELNEKYEGNYNYNGKDPLETKLILFSNFTKLIISLIALFFMFFLSEYLDILDYPPENFDITTYSTKHLYILVFLFLLVHFLYSVYANLFLLGSSSQNGNFNILPVFMNSIFSILGNTMTICSTGACSSIYISTLTAFFSAFGISIVDWLPYLKYSAILFILVSIISLYSVRKSLVYLPFILCVFGSGLIIYSMFLEGNHYWLYLGNVLMIVAALWNAKIHKAGFGKSKKSIV